LDAEHRTSARLGELLADGLGDGVDEARLAAQRRAVTTLAASPQGSARPARRLAIAVGAIAAGMLIGIAAYLFVAASPELECWIGDPSVAAVEGQWVRTGTGVQQIVGFSDGSRFEWQQHTAGRIVQTRGHQVLIDLEDGRIDAAVVPGGETRWVLRAGPYRVTVLGTQFNVGWSDDDGALEVVVERGRVRVSGPGIDGDGIALAAGTTLRAAAAAGLVTLMPAGLEPDVRDSEPEPAISAAETASDESPSDAVLPQELSQTGPKPTSDAGSDNPGERRRRVEREPEWRALYEAKDYAGAVAAARRIGLDRLKRTAGPDDLWALANATRYARQTREATDLFEVYRQRFAGSGRAPAAAFLLAKLALDQRGDLASARTWLERYLKEAPNGSFAEEALGRLMDVCRKTGRAAQARRLANEYLARFDGGYYSAQARAALQQ